MATTMPSTPPLLGEGTQKSFRPEGRSLALFTPPLRGGGEHNRVAFRTAVYSAPLGERGGEMERGWMLLLHAQPTFYKKKKKRKGLFNFHFQSQIVM